MFTYPVLILTLVLTEVRTQITPGVLSSPAYNPWKQTTRQDAGYILLCVCVCTAFIKCSSTCWTLRAEELVIWNISEDAMKGAGGDQGETVRERI